MSATLQSGELLDDIQDDERITPPQRRLNPSKYLLTDRVGMKIARIVRLLGEPGKDLLILHRSDYLTVKFDSALLMFDSALQLASIVSVP